MALPSIILRPHLPTRKEIGMLLALAAVLLVLWLLGFFVIHIGSVIHILLVLLVIAIIWHFVKGAGRGTTVP